ncbi:MAG TPA: hypothetical protein VE553_09105 [Candidatus Binatia bacterium]|jgi:regulator of replication initiation timing|nr:hypothetical protein [Candidatus Binatia bacterium]
MTTHANDEMGRRSFLKALALSAIAATTVGGGAGYLSNKLREEPLLTTDMSVPPPPASVTAAETVATANNEVSDLLAQLASAQADNMRLRSELDAAQRRLSALETASGDTGEENQALRTELAAASENVSVLAGLVALYEQLDDGALMQTVEGSLANFGQTLGGLLDEIPSVEEGLALGNQALDQFEARVPALADGRNWLESHMARLNAFYAAAESVLENVVESAGTFLQKLEEWFQGVRKWLPFGVGDRAAQVMAALTNLLDETPNTIQGLRRNIADPLDAWVGKEGQEAPLRAELLRPLRETTLQRSGAVVERARSTGSAFEEQVSAPMQEAIARRRTLREQIAAYRQQHGI